MSAFIVGLAMSILWVSSSVSGDRSHLDVVGLPVSFAESDPSKWRHSALLHTVRRSPSLLRNV